MLNDTCMKVFPSFLRCEDWGRSQKFTVDSLYTWPSHELPSDEAFHEIAGQNVSGDLGSGWVLLTSGVPTLSM